MKLHWEMFSGNGKPELRLVSPLKEHVGGVEFHDSHLCADAGSMISGLRSSRDFGLHDLEAAMEWTRRETDKWNEDYDWDTGKPICDSAIALRFAA